MGQKTNPIGLRLGIIKPWESRWFSERVIIPSYYKTLI